MKKLHIRSACWKSLDAPTFRSCQEQRFRWFARGKNRSSGRSASARSLTRALGTIVGGMSHSWSRLLPEGTADDQAGRRRCGAFSDPHGAQISA